MNKNILILHLLRSEEDVYHISNKKFCDSDTPINYDLVYIPMFYENVENNITQLKDLLEKSIDVFYRTVIFCNVDSQEDLEIINNMVRNITFEKTVMYLKTSKYLTHLKSKKGIQIINALGTRDHTLFFNRYSEKGIEYIKVDYSYFSEDIKNLECAWWFNLFINKVFDCGLKRLKQFSGTCYINSVINGFILGKNASKLISNYLENLLLSEDIPQELKEYIKEDIKEDTSCPFYNGKTSEYLLRLFYNILQKTPIHSEKNIMNILDNEFRAEKGQEGGFPPRILQSILNTFKIPYLKFFRNLIPDPTNAGKIDTELLAWIYPTIDDNVPEQLYLDSDVFNLEFGVIYFRIKTPEDEEYKYHVVCGFICDGVYKIYDSSTNYIYTFDWRNMSNSDSFIKKTSALWRGEVSLLSLNLLVYTKNSNSERERYTFTPEIRRNPGKLNLPIKRYE
jgi:hypothetical protein